MRARVHGSAAFFAALFALSVTSEAWADPHVHVVAAGESLDALARRYDTSVEALRQLNDIEGDRIVVGQALTVEPPDVLRYTIVPGDTLGCIAIRFGVSLDAIREENPDLHGRLEVGRTLRLPGGHDPHDESVEVREGDTASAIAARLEVSVEDLARANDGVNLEHLAVGAHLHVPVSTTSHRVREGETLTRIARHYAVSVDDLRRWNPDVEPRALRPGTELSVRPGRPSESVGAPTCGWILGDVPVPEHPAYVLRNPDRSWATRLTALRLTHAFDAVARAERDGPRVRVHDASLPGGGPIDDHRSHQAGRDVDITYYQRHGCGGEGCPLRRVDPDELDVRRTWRLLRQWLRRDEAEAIFVDYALQAPLYREARRRGATTEELERWFQYPRGRWHHDGVIRHFPNHRDHLHVRFACGENEARCH